MLDAALSPVAFSNMAFSFCTDLLWKKVCSGYKFGSIYLIDSNHKLYCLLINSMTKHDISAYTGAAQDVSCAAGECWITRTIQKCRKIKLTSGCTCNYETVCHDSYLPYILSYSSFHIYTHLWKTQPNDQLKSKGHNERQSQSKYSIFHYIFNHIFNQHYQIQIH